MQIPSKISIILVIIIFTLLLSVMQFSYPYIIGFDGYYHIKTAEIIKEEGFIKEFPWAKFTILSKNYADIQPLFRIFHIPFIALFGLTLGAKIASVVFAVTTFTLFYWFLTKNNIKFPLFWALLYLSTSTDLAYRFLLPRQMPLAIALLILTMYFLQRKKYQLLGLTSFIFVWLYSGFVIQVFVIFVYFFVEKIFTKKFDYKIILHILIGTIFGVIINPYFPNNLSMLYTQIFKVNLLSNLYNVEWKPWPFLEFIKNNAIALVYFTITILILIKNKKATKIQSYFLALSLFFFIYTIISRRMQEYFVPFAILAAAFVFNEYFKALEAQTKLLNIFKICGILLVLIIGTINFMLLKQDYLNTEFFHNYAGCAEWMRSNIPKGSLVFNNAYAFPYLFFQNSDLIYSHGIDLTYSYLYEQEKFKRYIGILQGKLKDKKDYIISDYSPDYVFSGKLKQDVQLFKYIVAHKENYKAAYEDDWCAVLRVK